MLTSSHVLWLIFARLSGLSFSRWENWWSETLSYLLRDAQTVSSRTGIPTQLKIGFRIVLNLLNLGKLNEIKNVTRLASSKHSNGSYHHHCCVGDCRSQNSVSLMKSEKIRLYVGMLSTPLCTASWQDVGREWKYPSSPKLIVNYNLFPWSLQSY